MSSFGPDTYGDPCRECGFAWSITEEAAAQLIAGAPGRYRQLLQGARGDEKPPEATWPVVAYVAHVCDNLRIWAERLAGVVAGRGLIVPYDQDALAEVKNYEELPLAATLWSLGRAAGDWAAAWAPVQGRDDLVLVHPEMGEQRMRGVIALVAHDTGHHAWDVERAVQGMAG